MGPRVEGNSMEAKEGMMLVTMASDRLADALDKTQWAKGFQWAEIVVIAQVMSVYTVKRDTVLWQEGHAEHYMGILAKGKVDILKSDHKGGDYTKIASISAGQSLGEMCLIDQEPRSAQAVAATDLVLLLLTGPNLTRLRDENPLIAYKLLWKLAQMLSQRLRKTSGQLIDFLSLPPESL